MAATVPMITAGMLPARVTNRMASVLIPNSRMAIGTHATDGMDCSPVTRGLTATRTPANPGDADGGHRPDHQSEDVVVNGSAQGCRRPR